MNIYTPSEMVRLELLMYDDPSGLHPVEENWRVLCRKLLQDTMDLEQKLFKHHIFTYDKCSKCGAEEKLAKPREFPKPFSPAIPSIT